MGWMLIASQMANNVSQSYINVSRYRYCVLCAVTCGVYRDTLVHQCIIPALLFGV